VTSLKTKEEALQGYRANLDKWQKQGKFVKALTPFDSSEFLAVINQLHRSNNANYHKVTADVLTFIAERGVVTSEEILEAGICTLPAFYRRMKEFNAAALIRRESRMFYIATPRFNDFYTQYKRYSVILENKRNKKRK
jgi:hypothetical protein